LIDRPRPGQVVLVEVVEEHLTLRVAVTEEVGVGVEEDVLEPRPVWVRDRAAAVAGDLHEQVGLAMKGRRGRHGEQGENQDGKSGTDHRYGTSGGARVVAAPYARAALCGKAPGRLA